MVVFLQEFIISTGAGWCREVRKQIQVFLGIEHYKANGDNDFDVITMMIMLIKIMMNKS